MYKFIFYGALILVLVVVISKAHRYELPDYDFVPEWEAMPKVESVPEPISSSEFSIPRTVLEEVKATGVSSSSQAPVFSSASFSAERPVRVRVKLPVKATTTSSSSVASSAASSSLPTYCTGTGWLMNYKDPGSRDAALRARNKICRNSSGFPLLQ